MKKSKRPGEQSPKQQKDPEQQEPSELVVWAWTRHSSWWPVVISVPKLKVAIEGQKNDQSSPGLPIPSELKQAGKAGNEISIPIRLLGVFSE